MTKWNRLSTEDCWFHADVNAFMLLSWDCLGLQFIIPGRMSRTVYVLLYMYILSYWSKVIPKNLDSSEEEKLNSENHWCQKHKQQSWVRSQHPSTQWNLRGGRWSSVELRTLRNPPCYRNIRWVSCRCSAGTSSSLVTPWPSSPATSSSESVSFPTQFKTKLRIFFKFFSFGSRDSAAWAPLEKRSCPFL